MPSQALLSALERAYGIVDVSVQKNQQAVLSNVYFLGDRYVLRGRDLSENTLASFQKEIDILQRIQSHIDLEIPLPIATHSGELFFVCDDTFWTVLPRVSWSAIGDWRHMYLVADAHVDAMMQSLDALQRDTLALAPAELDMSQHPFYNMREQLRLDAFSPSVSEKIQQAFGRIDIHLADLLHEKTCFVHGDWHPGNVLIDRENIVGMVDFDWCHWWSIYEDRAYFFMMLLRDYRTGSYVHDPQIFMRSAQLCFSDFGQHAQDWTVYYLYYDWHLFGDLSMHSDQEYQKELLEWVVGVW